MTLGNFVGIVFITACCAILGGLYWAFWPYWSGSHDGQWERDAKQHLAKQDRIEDFDARFHRGLWAGGLVAAVGFVHISHRRERRESDDASS